MVINRSRRYHTQCCLSTFAHLLSSVFVQNRSAIHFENFLLSLKKEHNTFFVYTPTSGIKFRELLNAGKKSAG
jgi:hypothetical protein